jgi:hypothetical protein
VDTAIDVCELLSELKARMVRMESALDTLVKQRVVKDFYTTRDVADLLGRDEYTVREWCRHRRVNAQKRASGRGKFKEWVIAHTELDRIQREGLLPLKH